MILTTYYYIVSYKLCMISGGNDKCRIDLEDLEVYNVNEPKPLTCIPFSLTR
jgi:hypothetical protein